MAKEIFKNRTDKAMKSGKAFAECEVDIDGNGGTDGRVAAWQCGKGHYSCAVCGTINNNKRTCPVCGDGTMNAVQ